MTQTREGTERTCAKQVSKIFADCYRAFQECSDVSQSVIKDMIKIMNDPEADADEKEMALATMTEALFPEYDGDQLGISIEEADKACSDNSKEGTDALEEINREEETFSARLQHFMADRGLTQAQLAQKAGIQQPAVSMMLARQCRPQQRTIRKLADALGVSIQELWPQ